MEVSNGIIIINEDGKAWRRKFIRCAKVKKKQEKTAFVYIEFIVLNLLK